MDTILNGKPNRPGLGWSVFLAILGVLGGYAFFFSSLIAASTEGRAISSSVEIYPKWASLGLGTARALGNWFTPILIVTGILIIGVLLRFLKPRYLRTLAWTLALWTFALLLASTYFYNCSIAGERRIGLAHRLDETFYSATLHRLLLIEAAEGQLDALQTEMGVSLSGLLVVDADPRNMPKDKLHRHLQMLCSFAKAEDSSYRKRALASLPGLGWRPEDRSDLRLTKKLLEAAHEITGEEHTNFKALVDWIEPKLDQDGWDPIPITYLSLDSLKKSIKE